MKTILLIFVLAGSLVFAEETNVTLTIDGVTYQNVRLGTVTGDHVSIIHSKGIFPVPLKELPLELQKRAGYEPGTTTAAPVEPTRLAPMTPVLIPTPAISTNLESCTLGDKVVKNAHMERRNPAEVTVRYSGGATIVPAETLSPELREFFRYDSAAAQEYLQYREANQTAQHLTGEQQPQKQVGYEPGTTTSAPVKPTRLAPMTPVPIRTPAISTNLDGWILGDKAVMNVRMERQNPAEITVWHSGGATIVPTETLPPELREFFRYDAATAQEFLRYRQANQTARKLATEQQQQISRYQNQVLQERLSQKQPTPSPRPNPVDAHLVGKSVQGTVVNVVPYVGILIETGDRRVAFIAGFPGSPSIGQEVRCSVVRDGDFSYRTRGGQSATCPKYRYTGL